MSSDCNSSISVILGVVLRFLQMSLDLSKIRQGDSTSVVSQVANNPAGRVLAWRFFRQNYDEFFKRYCATDGVVFSSGFWLPVWFCIFRNGEGSFDMSTLIIRTASHFSSQFDYDEVLRSFNFIRSVHSIKCVTFCCCVQVKAFYETHETGSGRRSVAQVLESIEMNINWLRLHESNSVDWFIQATNENVRRDVRSLRTDL